MRPKLGSNQSTPFRPQTCFLLLITATLSLLGPELACASVESSLLGIQNKVTHVILPVISVIGIAWAAFSLLTGNERAKAHIWYAIIGSVIGFGAQSIVDFISQTVN